MRYAVVSDIHANLQAWEAVVADMAVLQIDHIICVGDIVGYGPAPAMVIDAIRRHASVVVVGNHDAAACGRMDTSLFNDSAREAIEWTADQLSVSEMQYLKGLPEKVRPDGADFLVVHAEVVQPMDFGYILDEDTAAANFAACDDRIIFIGHTHRAGYFVENSSGEVTVHDPNNFCCDPQNRYIINPGSVGDPRSTEIKASYTIYDDVTREVQFRFCEFDVESYRTQIDATKIVSRPYFIRYFDEISAGAGTSTLIIPSAEVDHVVSPINLSAPETEVKKKDPVMKVGVCVLLVAVAVGVWFFSQNMKGPDADDTTRQIASNGENQTTPGPDKTGAKASEISGETTAAELPGVAPEKLAAEAPEKTPVAESETAEEKVPQEIKQPEVTNKLPVTARYVRISLPRMGILCLAEVEVFSDGKNVALQGKATQSSTIGANGSADKAIDGDRTGEYKKRHISHTKKAKANWWLLDLGKEYPITSIVIFNRNERGKIAYRQKIWNFLDGHTLEILDKGMNPVFVKKDNKGNRLKIVVK